MQILLTWTMYVYLKRGSVIKRFRNVILSECYQPKVDGVTVERIEPGLWFKVLFVDSLFVDCDGRDVSWNKETCVEAETIHKTKADELQVETLVAFFQSKGTDILMFCVDVIVMGRVFLGRRGIERVGKVDT